MLLGMLQGILVDVQLVDAVVSRHVDEVLPAALPHHIVHCHSEVLYPVDRLEPSVASDFSCVDCQLLSPNLHFCMA